MPGFKLLFKVLVLALVLHSTAQAQNKNCITKRGNSFDNSLVGLTAAELIDVIHTCSVVKILPTLSLPGEVMRLDSVRAPTNCEDAQNPRCSLGWQSSWKAVCCPKQTKKVK